MKGYNILNRPGRKKTLFSFCLVFLMAIAFFYINSARMDDFTSLITDASLQYQVEGVMKDYTTDVKLEDNTPLTFTIKATVPQGTLASTQQITYNLPQHLQVHLSLYQTIQQKIQDVELPQTLGHISHQPQ